MIVAFFFQAVCTFCIIRQLADIRTATYTTPAFPFGQNMMLYTLPLNDVSKDNIFSTLHFEESVMHLREFSVYYYTCLVSQKSSERFMVKHAPVSVIVGPLDFLTLTFQKVPQCLPGIAKVI